jgi:uncharacterized RDD family membrane protein YckC
LIRTCPQCGALNEQQAEACCFCDFGLNPVPDRSVSTPAPVRKTVVDVAPTAGNLAVQADWHQEVHSRLAAYKVRRRNLRQPEGQTALPFSSTSTAEVAHGVDVDRDLDVEREIESRRDNHAARAEVRAERVDWLPPSPAAQAPDARSRAERYAYAANNRVEIAIEQPALDWSGAPRAGAGAAESHGAPLLRPVASLSERRLAGMLDAAFLLFTFGGILALFSALGGRFTLTRLDAAIAVAALGMFYAQYFTLFTVFGGSTPGMMLRNLRVVSFDGDTPTPRQMLWRSFGYLISAGTFMLGFLWALWDEDHLCWQDRISQTYLTPAIPAPFPGDQPGNDTLGSSAASAHSPSSHPSPALR